MAVQDFKQQIVELKESLSKMNQQFELSMKNNNITKEDLAKTREDFKQGKLPKEMQALCAYGNDMAKRAGEQARVQTQANAGKGTSSAGVGRRGAIRI